MNILIIGSSAREHALTAALHRSAKNPRIFCCGSSLNPGIQQMTVDYWVGEMTDDIGITKVAKDWQIDFALIGPEVSLEIGLADALWQASIPTIGPKRKLAQIETSKRFARDLMQTYRIPGIPRYQSFQDLTGIESFLYQLGEGQYVVKANGLMGGKGVKVAGDHLSSIADALSYCNEIMAKKHAILIEERLIGQEFSLMCFCDGEALIPMPIVQDHKRAFVGDLGPNTGGMGSYSDANHRLPFLTEDDVNAALSINEALVHALAKEFNEKYIGILYGSFIATAKGVEVIEFNARFGDPEALNVLTILSSDFVAICEAIVTGNLSQDLVRFEPLATVCKYAVPEGYPDTHQKEVPIDISAVKNKARLYLGSVKMINAKMQAIGSSRTAAYVGVGSSISAAERIAEKEIRGISGPLFHREDIGTYALIKRRVDEMKKLRAIIS